MALHWKLLLAVAVLLPFAEFGLRCDTQWMGRKAAVLMTAQAVENFRSDCGRLPYSLDELIGPVAVPAVCQGRRYVGESGLRDGYGYLHYWKSASDAVFVVRSTGRDRVFGTADDYASDSDEPGSWHWPWPDPHKEWLAWLQPFRPVLGFLLIPILLVIAAFSFTQAVISAVAELVPRIGRRP
ncbi:hypothetical protein [Tahibacter harae]|uniref:Type II secretion system protein GspG C-terminal domain-containing protein n=1 Tax=Tahibacter harae TaxID=2963937 RepID=A0ABT1QPU0_9GAMM|nr:hypothetical protein [Tahibacter harae]MCQ4164300.1 hypothetical protein [Tahibacter harae]